mmetsp:Transcript_44198/g.104632  ORF Transcript_44198/g.104632 Transcript_44198/m.104632 type:complete len:573 (+) Transcript_44198:90-1808(+)|eukprot:CAMPEP_0178401200 /NCGR_PEP_ID=MMETSP0689_2-20121128/16179_1 /TAXON_ID=160604 /ORGANISM="Amphidinium massartii, Strain CS-259" /LENGTH=572 /DNA_ID=CAMNT_0020022013 /DNA_START=77 /DNA_END=1795 /DNA_ORIENTATION=-
MNPPMDFEDEMDPALEPDMDDDEEDDDDEPDLDGDLPEGIQKEIVKEAPVDAWQRPKAGDDVNVHYVGTLASDGSEFDSSRARGQPFTFCLGRGQVIKGWDKGVATMKKGEIAKFTLAPEFAYGEAGSPPKIPADATLVFEVELLSWTSKDDLFQDGGVIKCKMQDGQGWQKPKMTGEVRMSLKVTDKKDGAVVEEKTSFEYVLGSGALGKLGKPVDKALEGMKRHEVSKLIMTPEYAGEDRPDGAEVEINLESIYDVKDVSFDKDGTVMKKEIEEGNGYERPKDACSVTLKVENVTDGTNTLAGFTSKDLTFKKGEGEVCDVLECVIGEMKKGEKAIVTCSQPSMCVEAQLGLTEVKAEKVVLHLELSDFEAGKETYSMSNTEKVEYGEQRKAVGGDLFKKQRFALASKAYKAVIDLFGYTGSFDDEELKKKAEELKKLCQVNRAACQLKVKDYSGAKSSCSEVLSKESANPKALYRRAQAELGLKNFPECIRDLKKLLEDDAENKEARRLLKEAGDKQKQEDQKMKGLYAKMCGGLGKNKKQQEEEGPPAKQEEGEAEQADDKTAATAGA